MQKKNPEIRKRILEVAKCHFLRYGYNSTQITKLAKEVGIHNNNIYTYFRNGKEDIYNTLTSSVFRDINSAKRDPELFAIMLEKSGNISEKISKLGPETLIKLI